MVKRYALSVTERYDDGSFRPIYEEYHSLKMAADHVLEYLERYTRLSESELSVVRGHIVRTGEFSLDLVGLESLEELSLHLSRVPCEVQSAITQRWLEGISPYEDILAVPECVLLNGHVGDCEIEYV